MHKHLQHLERLSKKMQFRYGDDDDLVMQLKHEYKSLEANVLNNSAGTDQSRHRHEKDLKASFASLRSATGSPEAA